MSDTVTNSGGGGAGGGAGEAQQGFESKHLVAASRGVPLNRKGNRNNSSGCRTRACSCAAHCMLEVQQRRWSPADGPSVPPEQRVEHSAARNGRRRQQREARQADPASTVALCGTSTTGQHGQRRRWQPPSPERRQPAPGRTAPAPASTTARLLAWKACQHTQSQQVSSQQRQLELAVTPPAMPLPPLPPPAHRLPPPHPLPPQAHVRG